MKDFNVNIAKLTAGITQRGFGLILILGTTKDHPYTLYNDIAAVAEDFSNTDKEYLIANRIFGQNPSPQQIAIYGKAYDSQVDIPADLATALDTVVNSNNDWFFLTSTENDNDVVTALSGWINTQEKMYFTTTQDLLLAGTFESEQTVVMYHNDDKAYVAEGLASYLSTATVGGVTAKFKTINGVQAASITATQLNELHNNNGFSYIKKMGVLQTTEGKTTSGEYIDVVMGAFFLQFRMEEEAALLAVNTPKIPYNNEGISMLVSVAENVLKQGVANGIILIDENGSGVYTINFTTRSETPTNDIINRIYNGIKWEAKLDGAIHSGTISGTLTY